VFQLVRSVNQSLDIDDLAGAEPVVAAIRSMCGALGLELDDEPEVVPDEIIAMAEEREAARAVRDFGRADALRDAITGAGWILDDSAGGTTVRRA